MQQAAGIFRLFGKRQCRLNSQAGDRDQCIQDGEIDRKGAEILRGIEARENRNNEQAQRLSADIGQSQLHDVTDKHDLPAAIGLTGILKRLLRQDSKIFMFKLIRDHGIVAVLSDIRAPSRSHDAGLIGMSHEPNDAISEGGFGRFDADPRLTVLKNILLLGMIVGNDDFVQSHVFDQLCRTSDIQHRCSGNI